MRNASRESTLWDWCLRNLTQTAMSRGEPGGGFYARKRLMRAWRWSGDGCSALLHCRPEQWYGLRATCAAEFSGPAGIPVGVEFRTQGEFISKRSVCLQPVMDAAAQVKWVGWFQTPPRASGLSVRLANDSQRISELRLQTAAERDAKCHPVANVPRWSDYRPPFELERLLLPAALERLTPLLSPFEIDLAKTPKSFADLQRRTIGAAAIIDPSWIAALGLTLRHIEALAANSWVIIDLETMARLTTKAGIDCHMKRFHDADDLMSARVAYADVQTRGFALQDVMPYSTLGADGYSMRVLRAGRAWKRYATECGFAPLLTSETPWEDQHGDVVSAARVVERGELMASDIPWIAAGDFGPPVAPQLARHLLRTHLGCALDEAAQYWNRWEDDEIVVRDIADATRRYPRLATARWASADRGLAHLGLTLPAAAGAARRHVFVHSGRMDARDAHAGLPAEPMLIFMKQLARDQAEGTVWARVNLAATNVTWQFDSAAGLRYAYLYQAASASPENVKRARLSFAPGNSGVPSASKNGHGRGGVERIELHHDEGLYGDRSIQLQVELSRRIRAWIET